MVKVLANHTMLIFYADGDGGVRTIVPQREQMCRATPAALQRLAPPLTMRPSHPCSHEVGQDPPFGEDTGKTVFSLKQMHAVSTVEEWRVESESVNTP